MTDYITTFSKINFRPLEPVAEDIRIEDIAHSLSMLCRANGHYESFYSVAAHSMNCYEEACARRETPRVKLACLLHDASESYLSDVTRPVKKYLTEYQRIEENLENAIYEKFLGSPLTEYEKQMVKIIDDAMLYFEFYEFAGIKLMEEEPYVAATPDFYRGTMKQVEQQFLEAFQGIDLNDVTEVKNTIKWNR